MTFDKEAQKNLEILKWMKAHAEEFRDKKTGEINYTQLVEAWDAECDTGEATLDVDHVAWAIAVTID